MLINIHEKVGMPNLSVTLFSTPHLIKLGKCCSVNAVFDPRISSLAVLKFCSIYSSEHSDFVVTHTAPVSCATNLRRISYPGFGKFMLNSKEALKGIIEICLVKPPEDFSSLCGILVSIRRTWQAQQLHRRSCNPSIMARYSKGLKHRQHTHRQLVHCEILIWFSARVPARFISHLFL